MRRFLLATFLVVCLTVSAQWKQSYPGQPSFMRELSVLSDQVIWAQDQLSSGFSISTNGGKNWSFKATPPEMTKNYLGGFYAINDSTAFIVSASGTEKGTYKSTNGGLTWKKLANGFNDCSEFPDFVYFFNDKDGIALGDGANGLSLEIMITRDGGDLWSLLPENHLPTGIDWSLNTCGAYKAHGDTLYVIGGTGRIFCSYDKGLNWKAINTPMTNGNNVYFDFKDAQHGLLSYSVGAQNIFKLYSTSNGGTSWDSISTSNSYSNLFYVPELGAYLSTNSPRGLSYSLDDGLTWTKHPSFENVGLLAIDRTSSGKLFMGGWGKMYYTTNPLGVNPTVTSSTLTGAKTLDVQFSVAMDPVTSQDTANYDFGYVENSMFTKLNLHSAVQDPSTPSLVHLTADANFPLDTLRLLVADVYDSNGKDAGFPVISNSSSTVRTFLPTTVSNASVPPVQLFVDANAMLQVSGTVNMDLLEVFDASGKQLIRQKFENKPVRLSTLKTGVYLIRLSGKDGVKTTEYLRK